MNYGGVYRCYVQQILILHGSGLPCGQIADSLAFAFPEHDTPSEAMVRYILEKLGVRIPKRRIKMAYKIARRSTDWVHSTRESVWLETEAAYTN